MKKKSSKGARSSKMLTGSEALFRKLDVDHDNVISQQELCCGLVDQGFSQDDVVRLFMSLDRNKDQKIGKARLPSPLFPLLMLIPFIICTVCYQDEFDSGYMEFLSFQKRAALGLQDWDRDERVSLTESFHPVFFIKASTGGKILLSDAFRGLLREAVRRSRSSRGRNGHRHDTALPRFSS